MKSYQFQFSRNAEVSFASMSKSIRKQILKKVAFFEAAADPFSFAKKLQGMDKLFRFRVGDYRLIVMPKDGEIFIILLILKIGHRKEIYE